MIEASAKGSSSPQIRRGRISSARGPTTDSWCSVPRRRATSRACSSSLKLCCANPTQDDSRVAGVIVERFHAQPVSRHQQPPSAAVVERERELATQVTHHPIAMLFVEMKHDLGVAASAESVTARDQVATYVPPSIELSV